MQRSVKLSRLRSSLGEIVEESRDGLEGIPSGDGLDAIDVPDTAEGAAARRGASKLERGQTEAIDDDELSGLEAIVMPKYRPAVFVRGGVFDAIERPWAHLNADAPRNLLQSTFASIGRIELINMPWTYGGTAFVVGPDLLMTNRHVARLFSEGVGERTIRFHRGDAAVDFKREIDSAEDDRSACFQVREVVMIHPYWDMALLRVEGLGAGQRPLTLGVREPETLIGREVIVVGYPARDDRSDLFLQDRVFYRTYNVKRVQPGKLRRRETIRSFGNEVLALTHDSSTLGGNSGSAVIDVTTGDVLALHFGGQYLKANYGVPAYELARDPRVVASGVAFRGSVAATDQWDEAWRRCDAEEGRARPVAVPAAVTAPVVQPAGAGTTMTFTIPIQVTVSIGAPSAGTIAVVAATTTVEAGTLTGGEP